jgi:hypothetical protein
MSRPYVPNKRGGYVVTGQDGNKVTRPNKTAAGMTATAVRSGHKIEAGDALSLRVRGTCARMARSEFSGAVRFVHVEPRRAITDKGREMLARMKARADKRKK